MKSDDHLPDRLHAGVRLPDGWVLTFPPSRACDCADCKAAYRALRRGVLDDPEDREGGLPW